MGCGNASIKLYPTSKFHYLFFLWDMLVISEDLSCTKCLP